MATEVLRRDSPVPGHRHRMQLQPVVSFSLGFLCLDCHWYVESVWSAKLSGMGFKDAILAVLGEIARSYGQECEYAGEFPITRQTWPDVLDMLGLHFVPVDDHECVHRERLVQLLAETPFELQPYWAPEYLEGLSDKDYARRVAPGLRVRPAVPQGADGQEARGALHGDPGEGSPGGPEATGGSAGDGTGDPEPLGG